MMDHSKIEIPPIRRVSMLFNRLNFFSRTGILITCHIIGLQINPVYAADKAKTHTNAPISSETASSKKMHDSKKTSRSKKTANTHVEHLQVIGRYQANPLNLFVKDLQASGVIDTLEAIRRIPGLNIVRNGGLGQTASLNYRGFFQRQIQVLLDDVPLNSPYHGSIDWNAIALNELERIEFIPMGGGITEGGSAMGAVLKLHSHSGSSSHKTRLRLSGGSQNTRSLGISTRIPLFTNTLFTNTWEDTSNNTAGLETSSNHELRIQAHHLATSGINAREHPNGQHQDLDGHDANHVNARWHSQITANLGLTLNSKIYRTSTDYDGNATEPDTLNYFTKTQGQQHQANVRYLSNIQLLGIDAEQSFHLSFMQKQHEDDSTHGNQRFVFRSQIDQLRINEMLNWSQNHQLHLGIDFQQRQILENSAKMPYKHTQRHGAHLHFKRFDHPFSDYWLSSLGLDAGIRLDQDSVFGEQPSYFVALKYPISSIQSMGYAQERSYRTPSFNELFFPKYGNPDLKPETANKHQLFWRFDLNPSVLQARVFHNQIDSAIQGSPPKNIKGATIEGYEISLESQCQRFIWLLSGQFQQSRDINQQPLLATPSHQLQADLSYASNWQGYVYRIGSSSHWTGEQWGNNANTFKRQRVAAYTISDLYINVERNPVSLGFRIHNLWDRSYQSLPGYPQPGRSWTLSGEWRF